MSRHRRKEESQLKEFIKSVAEKLYENFSENVSNYLSALALGTTVAAGTVVALNEQSTQEMKKAAVTMHQEIAQKVKEKAQVQAEQMTEHIEQRAARVEAQQHELRAKQIELVAEVIKIGGCQDGCQSASLIQGGSQMAQNNAASTPASNNGKAGTNKANQLANAKASNGALTAATASELAKAQALAASKTSASKAQTLAASKTAAAKAQTLAASKAAAAAKAQALVASKAASAASKSTASAASKTNPTSQPAKGTTVAAAANKASTPMPTPMLNNNMMPKALVTMSANLLGVVVNAAAGIVQTVSDNPNTTNIFQQVQFNIQAAVVQNIITPAQAEELLEEVQKQQQTGTIEPLPISPS